jgi:predicted aldo/keto reductase-like oxidoreductase
MQYKLLGKTNLKISVIGFGGIPIQRLDKEQAVKVVSYAIEKGINFFDSARAYTVSESYIGEAIKDKRSQVILATKGPATDYKGFKANICDSLTAFNTHYIDLYQVHNIKDCAAVDRIFGEDGAYSAFVEEKAKGKVNHFGLTCHKREVLQYALDNYGDKIETIMFPYNIVETQGEELFESAKQKNIGVVVMKPLAGGNLTNINLALRFCAVNPCVSVVIPGMASFTEIDDDIEVDTSPLTEREKAECIETVRQLGNSFCRRCGYCAPCSAGIDIPTCFTFQNYLKNYSLADWAYDRYKAMKATAEKCVKCGECIKRCPYELDIIHKLENVAKDFDEYAKKIDKK